jgi:hypothetical protein
MRRAALTVAGALTALAVASPAARGADPVIQGGGGAAVASPPSERPWSIMFSGGLVSDRHLYTIQHVSFDGGIVPRAWQLEIVKVRPDRWMWGFGLDDTTYVGPGTGAFVLGGLERRLGPIRAELAVGLGIEQAMLQSMKSVWTSTNNVSTTAQPQISTTVERQYVPYARAFGTLGFPVASALDVVLRLGVHTISTPPQPFFLESAIGVRYRLP